MAVNIRTSSTTGYLHPCCTISGCPRHTSQALSQPVFSAGMLSMLVLLVVSCYEMQCIFIMLSVKRLTPCSLPPDYQLSSAALHLLVRVCRSSDMREMAYRAVCAREGTVWRDAHAFPRGNRGRSR